MTTYHPNGTSEDRLQEKGMADKVRASAAQGLDDAQQRASAAAKELEKSVRDSADTGARFIRDNPGIALAGAVGLGVLIGLGLGNRR